jgi:branched-chain amino acid transport system substrate-binding protein
MNTRFGVIAVSVMSSLLAGIALVVPATAADVVKIGVIYSLTGPGAGLGKLQQEGAKVAIKEVNEKGGVEIAGKKLRIEALYRDDETKAPVAIRSLNELVKEGVTAVVGGTFGNVSLALNNEVKNANTFFMATNGVPDDFFKKGVKAPTAACIVAGGGDAGRAAAEYIAGKMKVKKVACFMPSYAIGEATRKGFVTAIERYPDVKYETFWHPVGSSDMKRDLTAVADFKPDVVFVGSWGVDAINALKQASEIGLTKKAKLFHFWLTNVFATGIPPEAIHGVWAQAFWYHDMSGFKDQSVVQASDEFTAKYMKECGNPPDAYAMAAYFGIKETVRAMELSKSSDPTKMYEALMQNPEWTSAKGKAKWRKDGRSIYEYFTWIVEGKGPDDRKSGKFDSKYDYAKIVDVYGGELFLPKLEDLGY